LTGKLALGAVDLLPEPPSVYLVESFVSIESEPLVIRFSSAVIDPIRFDANLELALLEGSAWDAILRTAIGADFASAGAVPLIYTIAPSTAAGGANDSWHACDVLFIEGR
jgi:hypothetical protein